MKKLLAVAFVICCTSLPADDKKPAGSDWPNWRGPRYDGIARDVELLPEWPKDGPKELWKHELGGGYGSVVVAAGRLITMTHDKNKKKDILLCLKADTGAKLWDFAFDADYAQHKALDQRFLSGPRSTPTIDGDFVYALGTLGMFHCLEVKTGKKVWDVDILALADSGDPNKKAMSVPLMGYCNSPLVVGDLIFVSPGGNKDSSLAALKKKDGAVAWKSCDDQIAYSTPIYFKHDDVPQVMYLTGISAVSVNPENGTVLWRHDFKTKGGANIATPVYSDGHVFLSADYGQGCCCLKLKGKEQPELVWKNKAMKNWFASSIIHEGHVYGFSTSELKCIDFESGKDQWKENGFDLGSVLISGKHLLVLSEKGELVLAELSPKKFVEKSRWHALECKGKAKCWSIPALAHGILYVRHETKLVALQVGKQR